MEYIDTLGNLHRQLSEFAAELRSNGQGLFLTTSEGQCHYLQPVHSCVLEEGFVRFETRTAMFSPYGVGQWEPAVMPVAPSHASDTEVFAENQWTMRLGRSMPTKKRVQLVVLPFERLPLDFGRLEAYIHDKAIPAPSASTM